MDSKDSIKSLSLFASVALSIMGVTGFVALIANPYSMIGSIFYSIIGTMGILANSRYLQRVMVDSMPKSIKANIFEK